MKNSGVLSREGVLIISLTQKTASCFIVLLSTSRESENVNSTLSSLFFDLYVSNWYWENIIPRVNISLLPSKFKISMVALSFMFLPIE